jgi:hypothetical protein
MGGLEFFLDILSTCSTIRHDLEDEQYMQYNHDLEDEINIRLNIQSIH